MALKTIVITGANRGIGLALAQVLSSEPDTLIIGTARNPSAATTLASLPNTHVVSLDLSEASSITAAAAAIAALAPEGIDQLWNNAVDLSRIHSERAPPSALSTDSLVAQLHTNVAGPLLVTQSLLALLRLKPTGPESRKIIFVSSISGDPKGLIAVLDAPIDLGQPLYNFMPYAAGKAALNSVAAHLWAELRGEGFTVQPLHPGWVKTENGGEAAPLMPEESARGMIEVVAALGPEAKPTMKNHEGSVV